MRLEAACGCVKGKVRGRNEDNVLFGGKYLEETNQGLEDVWVWETDLTDPAWFGVFDGMGGERHGQRAAFVAARGCAGYVSQGTHTPDEVCVAANRWVWDEARERLVGTMGCAAVLARFFRETVEIANVGDSKAFLLRDGEVRQISVDHTDEELLRTRGVTTRTPRLSQYLGIDPAEMVIEPHRLRLSLRSGDRFLLCSDGVTDMVEIGAVLAALGASSMAAAVKRLLQAAMDGGGRDNATAICCAVEAMTED